MFKKKLRQNYYYFFISMISVSVHGLIYRFHLIHLCQYFSLLIKFHQNHFLYKLTCTFISSVFLLCNCCLFLF